MALEGLVCVAGFGGFWLVFGGLNRDFGVVVVFWCVVLVDFGGFWGDSCGGSFTATFDFILTTA